MASSIVVSNPSKIGRLNISDNQVPCPTCGRPSEVQNIDVVDQTMTKGRGNSPAANDAFREFQERTLHRLDGLEVSRQQLRRFERAISSGDDTKVLRVARETAPELETVTADAISGGFGRKGWEFLKRVLRLVKHLGAGYLIVLAAANGTIQLVEAIDKYDSPQELLDKLNFEDPGNVSDQPPKTPIENKPFGDGTNGSNDPIDI